MKWKEFIRQVCIAEGKKESLTIAQVGEVLRVANDISSGKIKKCVENIPEIFEFEGKSDEYIEYLHESKE